MQEAIAFCVDDVDQVTSLEGARQVRVYERCLESWRVAREFPLIRDARDLAHALADCFAFVGDGLGVFAQEFERLGTTVWELAGDPGELADLLWKERGLDDEPGTD